ncbi:hypothetical protein ACFSFZ_13960 [Mixta tenebrionis]|uniref:Right-handed parallel beta-helix repeat-containing protein n=1 Tax=Mixta tenebrionis TaxID=2562439 RepID=A0A506VC44_9GAMM|nr:MULTISPECIES: hypothetical protein [Mixta]QHM75219.1 hypothetical protein C7M52_01169 [Mixta theicola]TPW43118.1 hypothetical protein FKM52_05995 [Mixta tenebrionis]
MAVNTSTQKISANGATDYTTDNTAAFQALLNKERHVIVDTIINLSAQVRTAFEGQIIEGTETGEIRPIGADMSIKAMVALKHKRCRVRNLKSTNPLLLQSNASGSEGGRQGTIDIQADFCVVEGCTMINQVNAVIASTIQRAHGSRIIGNNFLDCLGVGLEDRGDAVSIWGSGTVIAHNYASCKAGTDGRIAFHAEAPVSANSGRAELDAQHIIMANNLAYGPFRRHFVMEGISNGSSIGNVSIGGATWWGEAYIMCTNVVVENTIKYTRTANDNQGSNWAPKRGAICVQNWSNNVNIRSTVVMDEESLGDGFVLDRSTTVQGAHKLTLQLSMINKGNTKNNGFNLVPAEDLHLNNCYAEGFANLIKTSTSDYNKVLLTGCRLIGNGTATGILVQGGSGGTLSINHSLIDVGSSDFAVNLLNLAKVHITSTGYVAGKYAVGLQNISDKFVMSNCYNLNSDVPLSVRYTRINVSGGSAILTQGDVPEIEWLFNENDGITCGFVYSQAQLKAVASTVNTVGKAMGKIVLGYGADKKLRYYYATAPAANASWISFDNTETVTPA